MACQDAKGRGNYPLQPSIKDVETWLHWAKWLCPIGGWNSLPSQGWRTQGNLLGKSPPPFQFQQLEARSSQVKGILCPPAPRCLTQSVFLPDELSYQDVQQQPFLLTVAYA